MTNWKTNLGGALGVLGTSLIGMGVLSVAGADPAHPVTHPQVVYWTTFAGIIISGLGKAVHALFSADTSTVQDLQRQLDQVKSDTTLVNKP